MMTHTERNVIFLDGIGIVIKVVDFIQLKWWCAYFRLMLIIIDYTFLKN